MKKRFFKTKDEVEVTFEVEDESAEDVSLLIESNDWQPVELSQRKSDGVFVTRLRLPKDQRIQFRYLVNGEQWLNDSEADDYAPNEFGGENSVVVTSQ